MLAVFANLVRLLARDLINSLANKYNHKQRFYATNNFIFEMRFFSKMVDWTPTDYKGGRFLKKKHRGATSAGDITR